MAFVQRVLEARFTLAQGGFAGTSSDSVPLNTLDIQGLRISAKCVNAGGAAMGECQMSIFGMTLSQMNTLSTLGMRIQQVPIKNTVTLLAGDTKTGLSTVFQGGIQLAVPDLNAQPEAVFRVVAKSGLPEAVTSIPDTSYRGAADIATVLAGLAAQAQPPLRFENNGVSVVMPNQVYTGSVRAQIQKCCENAGVGWTIDNGVLAIWPRNGSRGSEVITIAPSTGMVGYPAYTAMGIRVESIFNPAVRFQGKVEIKSDQLPSTSQFQNASSLPIDGLWTVYKLEYDLDSQVPHGNWKCAMECYNPVFPTPVAS
jgi:hypothetical protein